MWLSRLTYPRYNQEMKTEYGEGIDVMDRDWDNLIILDACRFDYLNEENTISGELRPVTSRGSTSYEFIKNCFMGRELHDTVYVTANPYVEELSDDTFYTVENLLINRWDEDLGTVRPNAVVDAAADAHERYPNKKLIVHFMQPHQPYLGPTAREIRDRVGIDGGYYRYQCVDTTDTNVPSRSWFGSVIRGDISHEELGEVYRENLNLALNSAEDLLTRIDGKSVVTADHGELLGERLGRWSHRSYGHTPHCYAPELRVVPWLETEGSDRRRIVAEDPIGFESLDQERVDDRLRALGYVP
jgi:hypothetical protein